MRLETMNLKVEKDYEEMKFEFGDQKDKFERLKEDNINLSNQVRILNENLRREGEVSISRERECTSYKSENESMKAILKELRDQGERVKSD